MRPELTSTLVIYDESNAPVGVVIFRGRDHTFYEISKMGADELMRLMKGLWADKKINNQNPI